MILPKSRVAAKQYGKVHGTISFLLQASLLSPIIGKMLYGEYDMREISETRGLPLARAFFHSCEARLCEAVPDIMAIAAIGLVGEGSECFGCDDEFSRDHDWGPAFCIWLPADRLPACASRLDAALAELPATFAGYPSRMRPECRMGRVGPLAVEAFYARFTGLRHVPENWREWRSIPEHALAACTNGEVFTDEKGDFSAWRNALLNYYPQDLWLKKLAARCMNMAQAGQYNLPRALQRGETVCAMLAVSRFVEASLGMLFLLNRRYMPFYKWAWHIGQGLPFMGESTAETLKKIASTPLVQGGGKTVCREVEELCARFAAALREKGLSSEKDSWLWAHGPQLAARISDPEIARLNLLED